MPAFGARSEAALATADERIQRVFREVVKGWDCTVICGHRGQEAQDLALAMGKSKKPWPMSKHNAVPSLAVDVSPYPIDWHDENRFYYFAGYVKAVAERLGIKIRYGGDWDGDMELKDQSFFDLDHFELAEDAAPVALG